MPRQQAREPEIGQLLDDSVLPKARAKIEKVDFVELLVLIETGEDEALFSADRVNMPLQTLRADLFHHALHRRVDRSDSDVLRIEIRRENAVPRFLDRAHHAVGSDGDNALHGFEIVWSTGFSRSRLPG